MTNTNPNLTATLVALRDGLLEQRTNIRGHREKLLAQLAEIDADLEDNATRIEAVDEVVAIHDPDHVRLEVRNSDTPTPLVVTPRRKQLQLTAQSDVETAKPTPETTPEPAAASGAPEPIASTPAQEEVPAEAPASTAATEAEQPAAAVVADSVQTRAEPAKKTRDKKAVAAEAAAPAAEAPEKKAKPRKSAAAKILISQYFSQFDKLRLIVKSLESRGMPTSANEVGTDIKAMYPIDLADQELRDIFSSNVSAYLNHMLKVGLVTKETRTVENGRDVRVWSLADGYRKLLKSRKPRGKAATKKTKTAGETERTTRGRRSTEAPAGEAAMAD
jgi:hypothetical protein